MRIYKEKKMRFGSLIARRLLRARRSMCVALALPVALLGLGALAPSALAQDAPHWALTVTAGPSEFAPGSTGRYTITAINTGGPSDGTPVTISDVLPAGVSASTAAGGNVFANATILVTDSGFGFGGGSCSTATESCTFSGTIDTGDSLVMTTNVSVPSSAAGSLVDAASVSGGGAPSATASTQTPVGTGPVNFAIAPGSWVAQTSTAQAGAHPDLTTSFTFTRSTISDPAGNVRDVTVKLPPGLVGSATATPTCASLGNVTTGTCPQDSMVGVATVAVYLKALDATFIGATAVYNLNPYPGEPAAFGFYSIGGLPVRLDTSVRSGSDYGVTTASANIADPEPALSTTVTLWGVPAEHNGPGPDELNGGQGSVSFGGPGSDTPAPLLINPTDCSAGPLTASLAVDSWSNGTAAGPASDSAQATMPAATGCDKLQFNPSMTVRPTTSVADSPSGVTVDLKVPQDSNPDGLATPELKNSTVTLPAGVSLSPTIAGGLEGCTTAQIALSSAAPATCPLASQVGTVTITTPLLPDPLTGQIFVGTPDCSPCTNADAQDGSMVHGYIQAQGDGVIVKLPGSFALNTGNGQITAHFDNNPQLPFSDLQLEFKSGPRGAIATPDACGTYTTSYDLQPWSSPATADTTGSDSFQITSGCVSGFSPSFTAGATNAQAGAYSPFVLSFSRSDSDQYFSGLSVKLPVGVAAKLAGVPLCSDADASAGICPAGSQVGTVEVGSGSGSHPFFLPGKAYLTGPYNGGPYGLAVVVPAVAGPFNLGTVVVRQALHIDPTTAQVTAVSDPFPTILDGIPLRIQRVDVNLNRPGFMVNPTSCDPMAISSVFTSNLNITADPSVRFQVGGCASLGFSPKLQMKLTGKGRTRSGAHPNLISVLTQRGGQANIHNVRVAMPLSLALDPNNSQHVCPYATAQAVATGPANCPASTLVGHATAVTPLLSQPLSGPVYLVQGIRMQNGVQVHTLPSLLIPLRGQIALDLRAQTSVSGGKLVTTFPTIPDAPVSKFTLTINGGHKGILVITGRGRSICASPQVTQANLIAQNGKAVYPNIKMGTPCRAVHHKKKTKHSARRSRHHTSRRG